MHTTATGVRGVGAERLARAAAAALLPTATLPVTETTNGALPSARSPTNFASGP